MLTAWAIGPLTFGAPALLWGAAAAAAPVLIHLMLRTRPRRQPFPAIRFILQTHAAAEQVHRLRRILLLVMRMLAIALIAALIAEPRLRATRWAPTSAGPASVVVCIDNSASMSYRSEDQTRAQAARALATGLVNDRSRLGEGSEFIVLTNQPATPERPIEAAAFGPRSAAATAIDAIAESGHDQPVGAILRRADELLKSAKHERREVYVFSDMTGRAWRDMPGEPFAPASGASIYCIDAGVNDNRNTALTLSSPLNRPVPAQWPARLEVTVSAGPQCVGAIAPAIDVVIDGEPRRHETLPELAAGQSVSGSITLPGLAEGLHRVRVQLNPADPFAWDNARFACLQVGEPPLAAVIGGAAAGSQPAEEDAEIVATMLAPPTLAPEQQRVRVRRMTAGEAETAAWKPFRAVVLADVPELPASVWRKLTDYAKGGGTVVVVLGPSVRPAGYAAGSELLPGVPSAMAAIDPPGGLLAADLSHPLLQPFALSDIAPLGEPLIFRAWTLAGPVGVLCPVNAAGPGLLERTVGAGRCVLLTFGLRREWSEFAAKAPPMIILLHGAVNLGAPVADRIALAMVGGAATARPGPETRLAANGSLYGMDPKQPPRRVGLGSTRGDIVLPTSAPGHIVIDEADAKGRPAYLAAINVADEESDLSRLETETVLSRFAPETCVVARTLEDLGQLHRRRQIGVDLAAPLGAVILLILIIESAFANRFYRRPSDQASRARTPGVAPVSKRDGLA